MSVVSDGQGERWRPGVLFRLGRFKKGKELETGVTWKAFYRENQDHALCYYPNEARKGVLAAFG